MLPPTRLTQLARDLIRPRDRVLDYWSPPQPEPRVQRLARWVMNGDIRYREHVTEGLENAPRAFIGMLNGENRGKALVKVA